MLRFLVLIVLALVVMALFIPGMRETLAWVLAFLSALMLGDLLRGSFVGRRRRGRDVTSSRT